MTKDERASGIYYSTRNGNMQQDYGVAVTYDSYADGVDDDVMDEDGEDW